MSVGYDFNGYKTLDELRAEREANFIDRGDVRERLKGCEADFVRWCFNYTPNLVIDRRHKEASIGDIYGSKGDSLTICLKGRKAGCWIDGADTSKSGDLISLYIERMGYGAADLPRALREIVEGYLGDRAPVARPRLVADTSAADALEEKHRRQDALAIFNDSVPIVGTLAERYLLGRRCELPPAVDDLRFHPASNFGGVPNTPCMVALVRDLITNDPCGIYRTALDCNGCAVELPTRFGMRKRLANGLIGNGSIKLWPHADVVAAGAVAVGEGLETVLSAAIVANLKPAWALGSRGRIAKLAPLHFITTLGIVVDNDEPGRTAAEECMRVWFAAGKRVKRFVPRLKDTDFNDILLARHSHD